jgi:hypothetical protein
MAVRPWSTQPCGVERSLPSPPPHDMPYVLPGLWCADGTQGA